MRWVQLKHVGQHWLVGAQGEPFAVLYLEEEDLWLVRVGKRSSDWIEAGYASFEWRGTESEIKARAEGELLLAGLAELR